MSDPRALQPAARAGNAAPSAGFPLHGGWEGWLAENLLRGCAPADLLVAMQSAGVPPGSARLALQAVRDSPVLAAALRLQQRQRKHDSVMAHLHRLQRGDMRWRTVERRDTIGTEAFLADHWHACRPLVLTGFSRGWPALTRWSPQALRDRFAEVDIEVQAGRDADPEYEMNSPLHRRRMRWADFIDAVIDGRAGNDVYLTANNHALENPALRSLLDDIGPLGPWFDRSRLARQSLLWIGARSVFTPLHHDTINLMHTQVHGRKRWRLVSPLQTPLLANEVGVFSPVRLGDPDLRRHPQAAQLHVLEVTLHPGDTLFLPAGWWHDVLSLDASVSLSWTNFVFDNDFHFDDPDLRRR